MIPIRLDETLIEGVTPAVREKAKVDIRGRNPLQIADLAVGIVLTDEEPAAVSNTTRGKDRIILRITSFIEADLVLLEQSFRPFPGWGTASAHRIPVELRLPRYFLETLNHYEEIPSMEPFGKLDGESQSQFVARTGRAIAAASSPWRRRKSVLIELCIPKSRNRALAMIKNLGVSVAASVGI